MQVFNHLASYNKYLNLPDPLHPYMDSRVCKQAIASFPGTSTEIQVNLFKIALKKNFSGDIKYGKSRYKTENGLMLFSEPGQVVSWDTLTFWDGYAFVFHPDLIKKSAVALRISHYKYFSYDIADALFLTAQEEETITWLFTKIHSELIDNKDRVNTDVILSLLNVILTCAETYYKRQFTDNEYFKQKITFKIKLLLQDHYRDLSQPVKMAPTVSALASQLNLSPNYLTDLVRQETGKSTIGLIQEYVIEQAEILLLQTDMNVSDIADRLGFDNIPYFSRLFKKAKGKTPNEVRKQGKV